MQTVRGGARKAALQIEHAGKTRATGGARRVTGLPVELRLSFGICVGKPDGGTLHPQPPGLELPGHVSGQLGEGQQRLLKYAGKAQAAIADHQIRPAAGLRQVELHAGTADSGCAWRDAAIGRRRQIRSHRLHLQLLHPALQLVLGQRIQWPHPFGRNAFDQAPRIVPGQRGQRRRTQRKSGRDLVQGSQIQTVGDQFAMRRAARSATGVQQPHVATWPTQALRRFEAKALGGKLQTPRKEFAGQATRDAGQLQRRQTGLQP